MLTCFRGATNVVFQKILDFYVKEGSIVLDITFGRGFSWKNLKNTYKIIKVDKRNVSNDVIQADFNDYLKRVEEKSIDCIYFDPPYYFREKIDEFDINDQMLNDENEVFWTEEEFEESLETLKTEIPRILKDKGVFITKIMDGYIGKKFFPLAFKLFEVVCSKMEPKGIFICPINKKDKISELIRPNHIYYMVFENKKVLKQE